MLSIQKIGEVNKYQIFIDGEIREFFSSQIALVETYPNQTLIDINVLRNSLTAYQIQNPTLNNLYSLNAARIDFVPYQFRPALKLIKSDTPRILIADSVGVGKTIEAGLILKELQARMNVETVLIICPKPLVAEHKWRLEMKRFDEEFTQLSGADLRQCVSDTDRDGIWPPKHNKTIIPYSLLSSEDLLHEKNFVEKKRKAINSIGLLDLDPPPRFDLIIVDEAHHIRNSNTQAYKAVKYLCDNANAVVFLTATPIQTSDNDLFTLLNVLRPDVILDEETFKMMGRPNQFISKAIKCVRANNYGWEKEVLYELDEVEHTQWGYSVIIHNPDFKLAKEMLNKSGLNREERVKLISLLEGLNSFSNMLNRTRRSDIQDFCIRRSHTLESSFTAEQKLLHDELLKFETIALAALHGTPNVKFMISTIRRQAASCIFGLAPFIRSIIDNRLKQFWDDPENDLDDVILNSSNIIHTIKDLSSSVLLLADKLSEDDPKFLDAFGVILNKQELENNKIIIFSTFKHTLAYIKKKLIDFGLRVEQIDGSVKDDDRVAIRSRFELPKSDIKALDILLFTEVGCEGLDYQFCDMMINYDLPWNPMRIEQRIGRIDRRGQKSDVVNIFNMITSDTVDSDIYFRCTERIGVFENSIGECSEILGQISNEIESIALNSELSDEERRRKLEQMSDNEIRKLQEINNLEQEEKELFGFDISSMTMSREVRDAENPWISSRAINEMVQTYLNKRIDTGISISGEKELKYLRLSVYARKMLYEDMKKLKLSNSAMKRSFEKYLKGNDPGHHITFDSECAEKNRNSLFITAIHPLAKMAADYLNINIPVQVCTYISSSDFPKGKYPFLIYSWDYTGYKPERKPIVVCKNEDIKKDLMELLQSANSGTENLDQYKTDFIELESLHHSLWQTEKEKHKEKTNAICIYKIESLTNSWYNRKRSIESKMSHTTESNIIRMYQAELDNAARIYSKKTNELKSAVDRTDIHTSRLVTGILIVGE